MATLTPNRSGQNAWSHLWLLFSPHTTFKPAANAPSSKYIWLWPHLTISTSTTLFHHHLLPELFIGASLTGLPVLLLPCSSFSLLLTQQPEQSYFNKSQTVSFLCSKSSCGSPLASKALPEAACPTTPSHITYQSLSCLLCARPFCCFSNQISTLPSHGLRHAVSSAWNTFLRELNSEIPHFLHESVQMPIYQWSFPWPPYIKQQCPQDSHPLYPTLFCHHLIYIDWFICTLPVSQTRI